MTEPMKVRIFKPPGKKKVNSVFREGHKKFILAFADKPYGLTDEELAAQMGLGQTNARGRRAELVTLGLIDGKGNKRKSNRGRYASAWTLTTAGVQKVKEIQRNERT